ncbi:helix-turn-helix transcriptional regulator [uncultured Campylobacter sp.]|uniref:helix-turn-helix domain-containing protein n=1 Tax=uncultured Campylobacter sp. TaxID=218934 RepID=UPI002605E217|nr:helix-turn-helix transcriptional regulator [uncultured Campylobacter sp.]
MAEEKEIYYDDEIEHVVTVSGKYIDKIELETEPKRSNYIKIKEELTQKVSALYGSPISPSKSGGNHIEFKDENKDDLYVIKWDYQKQNIVKQVCRKLGITQRELAERMDIPESTVARWKGGDLPRLAELYLNALLENIKLKSKLEAIKKAHEIVSNL